MKNGNLAESTEIQTPRKRSKLKRSDLSKSSYQSPSLAFLVQHMTNKTSDLGRQGSPRQRKLRSILAESEMTESVLRKSKPFLNMFTSQDSFAQSRMRLPVNAYNEQSRTNVFCRHNLHQKSFQSVDGPDEHNFVNNGQSIANHLRFTSTDQKFYNSKSLISETYIYLYMCQMGIRRRVQIL